MSVLPPTRSDASRTWTSTPCADQAWRLRQPGKTRADDDHVGVMTSRRPPGLKRRNEQLLPLTERGVGKELVDHSLATGRHRSVSPAAGSPSSRLTADPNSSRSIGLLHQQTRFGHRRSGRRCRRLRTPRPACPCTSPRSRSGQTPQPALLRDDRRVPLQRVDDDRVLVEI